MGKKIKHMGMNISEEEDEAWNKNHPPKITKEQHKALMKKMGSVRKKI